MKPRNGLVPLALFRKAGAHKKTEKAKRRSDKMSMQRALHQKDSQESFC